MTLLCSIAVLGLAVRFSASHTQHLHPPVEIDPLPPIPQVKMPHMQPADMTAFISQAESAMSDRFEKLEPAIYNKGKQCFVLQEQDNRMKTQRNGYYSKHLTLSIMPPMSKDMLNCREKFLSGSTCIMSPNRHLLVQ
jgi:hypothetical protein